MWPEFSLFTSFKVLLVIGCFVWLSSLYKRSRSCNYPPGPKPLFILGNIFDFPASSALVSRVQQWKQDYGSIVHLSALGTHIIILNDAQTAVEVLEKRGSNYADRPVSVMVGELCGFDRLPAIDSDGFSPRLRALRKLLKTEVGVERLEDWEEIMENEVLLYVEKLRQDPENFMLHNRWFAVNIIMLFSYGHRVTSTEDYHMVAAERIMSNLSRDAQPGTWLVDIVPALRYIPQWMPGAYFHRYAAQTRKELDNWVTRPWETVKSEAERTTNILPSFCSRLMDQYPRLTSEEEDLIVWSAASIYSAGSDTTVSALTTFFLAMTMFPSVQTKAQQEIDRVIGSQKRMPRFSDCIDLPYISALLLEIFRWGSILPLGAPRRASNEAVLQSYTIPKHAIILPNIWGICHDTEVYPSPMEFDPSRFLGDSPQPDPRELVFGFGRRVCPGRHMAEKSLYISVAATLAMFDITELEGSTSVYRFDDGFISHPTAFRCKILPRDHPRSFC